MRHHLVRHLAVLLVVGVTAAACGSDGDGEDVAAEQGSPAETADVTIAVTTTVLGDVVDDLVGDLAEVVTIMPPGANAHDFQASAREAAVLAKADAIVVNGGGFEEGLLSVVEGAESDGVPVIDALSLLGDGGGDEHGHEDEEAHEDEESHAQEEGHAQEDGHGEADEHAHDDDDAHFFTDPLAVAEVVDGLADALADEIPSLDGDALRAQADAVVADLEALHDEIESTLAGVPEDRRVLVTDHDVLGSFADRYDFEVVATVIPTGSTSDGVSGGALADLASLLQETGVTAVFTEQTASSELVDTLASEVGEVDVVALYAESLGPEGSEAATYAAMMRLNAQRIADALGD